MKLLSSRKANPQPVAMRAVNLLIQFFTLLALLCTCNELVNDRGSKGVQRPGASGPGSLHSVMPIIHPLRFFYPTPPQHCQSGAVKVFVNGCIMDKCDVHLKVKSVVTHFWRHKLCIHMLNEFDVLRLHNDLRLFQSPVHEFTLNHFLLYLQLN